MALHLAMRVALVFLMTVALAWVILGLFALTDSADPWSTLVDQTPRVLFGLLSIALALWLTLLTIGAIVQRARSVAWRIATHLVSLLIALIVNVGLLSVVAVVSSGGGEDWGMLVVAIAVGAGGVLLVSGVAAVLTVELGLESRARRRMASSE